MSFSRPTLTNPSKKFIEWKSDDMRFSYYDKVLEQNVPMPLPIYFVVLDELSCVTGFCKKHKSKISSNEVRSTVKEPLLVRTFRGGERITGLYQDIKDEAVALGGKYTKSIYAMLLVKNQLPELVNIKLRGGANGAWIEKKINIGKSVVCVKEAKEEANGNTTYNVPVFSSMLLSPELIEAATQMDIELQVYLESYLAQKEVEVADAQEVEPQLSYVADMDAKLRNVINNATTHPGNAILDSGWVKADRKAKETHPGPISDPALLDEGPRNVSPEDLEPGVDDLPF
jgi:hypothetical protein